MIKAMIVHVRRDGDGKINAVTRHPYEDENGKTDETLPEDHPEVVEFYSARPL